jgi:coproporphyrinogen III oxidase-like Fe-S oxidoreductase
VYWERRPYEAVGPGAHAFDGATRRWNVARLDRYVAALVPSNGGKPTLPPGGTDPIDETTAAAETVVLGLRTNRGLPLSAAGEPPLADWFGWALAAELLDVTADDRIVLTTRGRLLSNELFARLI